jgi:acid phosphatase
MPRNNQVRTTRRSALAGQALLLIVLFVSGCATTGESVPAPGDLPHDGLDAVTWLQTSTEYAAVTRGIFATATAALTDVASAEGARDRRLAVVMDVDETVLDNARYQVQLVRDGTSYDSDSWDRWIALRGAEPVPGVVDFVSASQSLGVHVAFVTNRSCRARPESSGPCPQHADTLANLEAVGIDTASVTLMLRGEQPPARCRPLLTEAEQADGRWSSDKTSRRACVGLDHDIVMLLGDQLGDFREAEDDPAAATGRTRAAEYRQYWGTSWFMLPNPTYGSWRPGTAAEKRALLRGTD